MEGNTHVLATITVDHSQNLQSRVWEPGCCGFTPQWLLGAVLLVGALRTREPGRCTWQSTYASQARLVALSPSKVLKSTLQSQAYQRQRPGPAGWPRRSSRPHGSHCCPWRRKTTLLCLAVRWHLLPTKLAERHGPSVPTVAVPAAACAALQLAATREIVVTLPGHQTSGSPASGRTMPLVPLGMMAPRGSCGNGPTLTSPLPLAVALGAQTGLCHLRGRISGCWALTTHPSLSHGQGKAWQSQCRPSHHLPCPLLPSRGCMSPPRHDGEAEGDAMRQRRLWWLLPFIHSAHGARAGAAPQWVAAPRWPATRRWHRGRRRDSPGRTPGWRSTWHRWRCPQLPSVAPWPRPRGSAPGSTGSSAGKCQRPSRAACPPPASLQTAGDTV